MSLLRTRRFLPLFVTQFLGAFNDNLFKNALVMLITYKIAVENGENAKILVTLAAGLFILPYFLFSATSGQLADKFDRAKISRLVKIAEILLMIIASIGFAYHSVWLLMVVLFCMGAHSTFFGPIKYALLPQHLRDHELLQGNAYIEAGTFLAILLGTIGGGLLVLHSTTVVCYAVIGIAIVGYITSRYIPPAPGPEPELVVGRNIFKETWRIIGFARNNKRVFLCILGISWFWLIGATFLAQFPTYAKDVVHGDETVVTLFLTVFSVGIGIGSMLCNKLLRGHISSAYVPLAAIGITLFTVDLYFASHSAVFAQHETLTSIGEFLQNVVGIRILFDLLMIAVCGGMYIVPLYAIMQHDSAAQHRARIIAANNVMNALFMVSSVIATLVMFAYDFTIPQVFLSIAVANGFVALYICKLLPDIIMRGIARSILRLLYRVEIQGLEHYREAGKRVLIVANHTSFLDAAVIAAFLPEKITFAVNTHIARKWWMQPFLSLVNAFPLDPTNPLAVKALIDTLKKDGICMIFPEGRITVTGSLMKIYEGPGMIADKSDAMILPIRIDGAQYSPMSRLKGRVRIRWFPKVTLTVLAPRRFHVDPQIKGRRRRQAAGMQLYDVMSQMMFESSDTRTTLFNALLDAQSIHGRNHVIVEDVERRALTYSQFIIRSLVLGKSIDRQFPDRTHIGLLLPNSVTTITAFFALHAFGRTPAMINFSSGVNQVVAGCRAANITLIFTSRRFVELARLGAVIDAVEAENIDVQYLEDFRSKITWSDRLFGLLASRFPKVSHRARCKTKADDPAVILFTSGSEGVPKGVVLSHANIQSNRYQLSSRVDFGPQDKVFNCLPMFHSFGLTGGTLLPLLSGIKAFYYPSPLHYRIVPELVYDTNSTIMFGTDTFLSGYARFAHPYDFHSVRYVFAGAEKLKEETRKIFSEKFGVRIFEGYGATETSPVISTNTPMQNRIGTVGRLMPSIEYNLEEISGITEGGKLWVRGPNIMLGYLRSDHPGALQPPPEGWYDTGDVVSFDAEGYITIRGRTKRFAKIGGEMVSLTAVEGAIHKLWPSHEHAVVTLPDEKKGEQIVLLTTHSGARRDILIAHFRDEKLGELAIPRKVINIKELPLLGTGKTDYAKATTLAADHSET